MKKKQDDISEMMINGVRFVREDSIAAQTMANVDGLDYVIVRGDRSGVFAGYLESRDGREVTLIDCRRIWYWDGAASISQLAIDGTSAPDKCKFPAPVQKIEILDAIEVIPCTDGAMVSIKGVSIWQK